ncbi:MAG: CpsD/CapB family tyrosine-protein kinase [Chloroflexi bacterium]|nr:CpsD/CapB family tyrosine-protein kinase [Chloroflexota bacterium]
MKISRSKVQEDRGITESISPLKVTSLSGETIVDLQPEAVSIYRRWYTYISREEPLPKRLGLVSSVRGEGVTSVSLGLASVMASDLEARIALVECNWWWPSLSIIAQLGTGPGFSEFILGKADFKDIAYGCSLPNLTFIPAGQLREIDRSRTTRSAALVEKLNSMSEQFDFLIMDIPAILVVKDSPVLAGLADALCFVIRQGITPMPLIKKALDEIEHLRVRGVILNALKLNIPKSLMNI